ncbi:MAG: PEP-CTERM sorting domain-containing protein [Opitutales bacterium]
MRLPTYLAGAGLCLFAPFATANVATELVIAFDDSGSISEGGTDGPEIETILSSISNFFTSSSGQQAIIDNGGLAVGLIRFGDAFAGGFVPQVNTFIGDDAFDLTDGDDLFEVTDAASANAFAAMVPAGRPFTPSYQTLTSPQLGIEGGNDILNASTRTGTERFILVIGDGPQAAPDADGSETEDARIDAVNDGITVAGLEINDNDDFYESFVVSSNIFAEVDLEGAPGDPATDAAVAEYQAAFDELMFEILGANIPEPGTYAAIFGGLAGLLVLARRRFCKS